jgi:hypothetical protein
MATLIEVIVFYLQNMTNKRVMYFTHVSRIALIGWLMAKGKEENIFI